METIYFALLFIAPGMIVKELQDYFTKEKKRKKQIYEYLFRIVFDSVVVGIFSVLSFQEVYGFKIIHVTELFTTLGILSNLWKYLCVMIMVSVIWCGIESLLLKLFLLVKNWILRKTKNIEHNPYSTTWDAMMNEKGIKGTWQVVSIYKDDHYLASGMIDSHTSTNADEFEIRLDRVNLVEQTMRTHPEIFQVQYEYLNTKTGFRVRMYKQKILEERWPVNNG